MKFYVYVYRDPRTMLPFYVGKGCGNRMFRHLLETYDTSENKKKYGVIKGLRNIGLEPIIGRYAKNLTEDQAYSIESYLIQRWGRRGFEVDGLLTNICIDHRPPSNRGRVVSDEYKQRMSDMRTGEGNPMFGKVTSEHTKQLLRNKLSGENNPFFGKTHDDDAKRIMGEKSRAFHTGRKRSSETKANMSKAQKGIPVSDEARAKISAKLTGTKQSDETKRRRAIKQIGRPRESNRYVWEITSPEGTIYFTRTFAGFCKEHSLATETLRKHENTGKNWNGWTVIKTVQDRPIEPDKG